MPDLGLRRLPQTDLSDPERERNAALDALFESLPAPEKAAIEERILADLAPFLRENLHTSGAHGELKRSRRREVAARYGK